MKQKQAPSELTLVKRERDSLMMKYQGAKNDLATVRKAGLAALDVAAADRAKLETVTKANQQQAGRIEALTKENHDQRWQIIQQEQEIQRLRLAPETKAATKADRILRIAVAALERNRRFLGEAIKQLPPKSKEAHNLSLQIKEIDAQIKEINE